ncbi:hypothetical protein HNY73_014698 [Argiope bruennichi]|uniref:Uncharacterized protein n=1 Tax=Argiope bruennichi TaxID=94029 RepID=A0A8T0ER11_ARGBR|nr:hypothetical protein HNY73_014698 [Argiope bruennichi]
MSRLLISSGVADVGSVRSCYWMTVLSATFGRSSEPDREMSIQSSLNTSLNFQDTDWFGRPTNQDPYYIGKHYLIIMSDQHGDRYASKETTVF